MFFGAQVRSAWPEYFPEGRLIPEKTRHITLAFLGNCDATALEKALFEIPTPGPLLGCSGIQEGLVFLPKDAARVVASTVRWLRGEELLMHYRERLIAWLKTLGYTLDHASFFPHISIARRPFAKEAWTAAFSPLPFFVEAIVLYESKGNLHYEPLWTFPLLDPFEEIEHTADVAFVIRGETVRDVYLHAQLALSFLFPPFTSYFNLDLKNSLIEIVIALNEMVSRADAEIGCPLKAVSFHGELYEDERQLLNWEMIVDV